MRERHYSLCALTAGIIMCAFVTADASNVIHMTLSDLVERGDRIVRGTVLAADEGTVTAGGGALPIVIYKIRVDEALKGEAGQGDVIDVRLGIAVFRPWLRSGGN